MLDKLQSNILKSHGRRNAFLLLLRFRDRASVSTEQIRGWMAAFARRRVTSASRQLEEVARFRETRQDAGTALCNFFLSPFGYKRLDLDPSRLDPELFPVSFARGMAKGGWAFNDPPQADWEEGYRNPIDAMILFAADDSGLLLRECVAIMPELLLVAEPPAIEVGNCLFNERGQRIEHFGFVDGIGNPRFAVADPGGDDFQQWDSRAEVDLVLAEDRLAPEPDCWGSFLVYRKLEQNVKKFRDLVRSLARQLPSGDQGLAEAMAIGRFRNGSPLALSSTHQMPDVNDFDFRKDEEGNRCPFHSHIRKMNPRGGSVSSSLESLEGERAHRITRRGITYGRRASALDDEPETGVGTLFLCFQRSISRQFAFLQRSWANRQDFPTRGAGVLTGLDPLAGRSATNVVPTPQQWPSAWDAAERVSFDFRDVVTLKGGEFFFAPSLPFLLAGGAQPPVNNL